MIISSPHVAALWGPWQPTQLRGAADKSGGERFKKERERKRAVGRKRRPAVWARRGVCMCARNQACYNS